MGSGPRMALALALALPALPGKPGAGPGTAPPANVLLVVADDVGVDRIGVYAEHPSPGHTPNIDRLAAEGVLFRNAWSMPFCSPTRATILTGRYPLRTGIGENVDVDGPLSLSLEETLLPEVLPRTWSSAAIGKWHLGNAEAGLLHPVESGFDLYAGRRFNLEGPPDSGDYFLWRKTVDRVVQGRALGLEHPCPRYATTQNVDDAIWAVRHLRPPWFVYLAFHAAHVPLHAPPASLHSYELEGDPDLTPDLHMKAMTEAMDTELGRLLAVLPQPTTVIFVGDNGTARLATTPPFVPAHAKGTVYEGGVNVPLIVRGPRVARAGSECTALVDTTDLFATVAELAGSSSRPEDSVSLVPYLEDPARPSLREFVYAEIFRPGGPGPYLLHTRAVREARFKLIRVLDRTGSTPIVREELYDLDADPFERTNLLLRILSPAARAAYARLSAELARLAS